MRKIRSIGAILILVLVTFTGVIFAKKIDLSMAQQVGAVEFQVRKQISLIQALPAVEYSIQTVRLLEDTDTGEVLSYILDLKPKGFVAISTDTDIRPVIAYSYYNDFSMKDLERNVLFYMLKEDMRNRLNAIPLTIQTIKTINNQLWERYLSEERSQALISELADADQWPDDDTGWLDTTWEQTGFYNNSCPKDPTSFWGSRCVVGCVAVAMGQIIYYWQYPDSVFFDSSDEYVSEYDGRIINIDGDHGILDFPSFDELNVSLANISYSGDKQEIADFLFACGIAVKMDYSDQGSEAWVYYPWADVDAERALKNKFRYQANGKYESDGDFYDVFENDMKSGQPALLTIYKENYEGGHAIVADGFRSTGEFHLNFGWGAGSPDSISEAWYFLPTGMPAGYTIVSRGVTDIHPNTPPNTPQAPAGPDNGTTNTSYTFTATTTDPEGDDVAFKFDWGDGSQSNWTSYIDSGSSTSMSHSWSAEGTYYVKAKAKDIYSVESGWSATHPITIRAIVLEVDPSSLDFDDMEKSSTKTMTFRAYNTGGGTLSGTISTNHNWITVSPTSFEGNDNTVSVTVETNGLAEKIAPYTGTVTVTSNGGTETVQIFVTVIPTGVVAYPNPLSLSKHNNLTFWGTGVPYAKIQIFTLAGELVKTLTEKYGISNLLWDGTNERGAKLARGIYIYVAKDSTGKIAIVK